MQAAIVFFCSLPSELVCIILGGHTQCDFYQIFSDAMIVFVSKILHMHCVQLLSTTPFCKNYAKLYFNAKHLKRLNRGEGEILGVLFSSYKKVPFLDNIKHAPNF